MTKPQGKNPSHEKSMKQGRGKKRGSDEDDEITDSQQAVALQKFFKKPKGAEQELQQFRTKVENNRKELNVLLEQKMRQAGKADITRGDAISELLSQAFHPPASHSNPNGDFKSYPGTAIAINKLNESASQAIESSRNLISEYNKLEKIIEEAGQSVGQPLADTWREDVEKTEKLLRYGRRKALRDVKRVLGADAEEEKNDGPQNEEGAEVMEGAEGFMNYELKYDLQKSLQYAERGVKRMVKSIPLDRDL